MEIKLYVEGGGKGSHKRATIKLQQGFDAFFRELKDKARERKISFKIIPSSNTQTTYDDFFRSIEHSPQSFNILLVDSDDFVDDNQTAREFLQQKYKKWKLQKVTDDQCHLMVQIMESWFLADIDALKNFYGNEFKENKLPKTQNIEKVGKVEVETKLKGATKNTKKGEYHKIHHGSEILQTVNPRKVRDAASFCNKLFEVIAGKIE